MIPKHTINSDQIFYSGRVKTCVINKAGGILIGVIVGVIALIAACVTVCSWRSNKKKRENAYNAKLHESRKSKKGNKTKHGNGSVSSIATSNSSKSKPEDDKGKPLEASDNERPQDVSEPTVDVLPSSDGGGAKDSSND
ncbi:hypothetical protein FRC17_006730 [Serendipita sp. 399]|nr:hypothetical protein FRC17_006730 [Serendipita sp. 399]